MLQELAIESNIPDPNHLQRQASDPEACVWVSASAGSGKTKVLTDRVLRLLLTGCAPHKILCLTFTKAAAAEMQERVKDKLKAWSNMPHADLVQTLSELTGTHVDDEITKRGMHLYDDIQASSHPIRIQTIHAFCQSILKQFPIEANISPHFEALDEREAHTLLDDSFKMMMADFEKYELDYFSKSFTFDQFYNLGSTVIAQKEHFLNLKDAYPHSEDLKKIYTEFFKCEYDSPEAYFEWMLKVISELDLKSIADQLNTGTATDQKKATQLFQFLEEPKQNFVALKSVFLTQKNELRKTLITKQGQKTNPELLTMMMDIGETLIHMNASLKAHKTMLSSYHYAKFACQMIEIYEQKKQEKFTLDFDDLILKTAQLLENSDALDWVLYKLDSGIQHILVDEAQDTNLHQWRIVMALVKEFFSGHSANEENRTIFVVGDEKQSIYSFQGASPIIFSDIKNQFETLVKQAGKVWRDIQLQFSFRSTAAVLDVVDEIFSKDELRSSILTHGSEVKHHAYRNEAYGKVTVWPLIKHQNKSDEIDAWQAPLQKNYALTSSKLHAKLIAKSIKDWLQNEKIVASKGRPVEPQDIMVLLRRRNHFFHEIVSALKQEKVPIAGVDRMVLKDQLSLEDLVSFGKFLLLPDDDLTLACLLKTPLIGLDDDDLFTLAYNRSKTLWYALKTNERYTSIFEYLNQMLNQVDLLSPFQLFQQILNTPCPMHPESGYKAMLSRLGYDIEDPVDEFLTLIQFYEKRYSRSLEQFIHWFEKDNTQIKRDVNQTSNAVQIMTIHGSKGLQAPIVILPDTVSVPRLSDQIFWQEMNQIFIPIYAPSVKESGELFDAIKADEKAAQASEYFRLFYVALTRAEDELVVSGHQGQNDPSEQSWYHIANEVLSKIGQTQSFEDSFAYTYEKGVFEVAEKPYKTVFNPAQKCHYPEWLNTKILTEKNTSEIIKPSQIKPEKLTAAEIKQRYERGKFIHALLEYLPNIDESNWSKIIGYLETQYDCRGFNISEILNQVKKLFKAYPDLFSNHAIVEMPLMGEIEGQMISAQLDRVLIGESDIFFVDYKTNQQVPNQLPEIYQKQMAYYEALLKKKYPNHEVKGTILWFETMGLQMV